MFGSTASVDNPLVSDAIPPAQQRISSPNSSVKSSAFDTERGEQIEIKIKANSSRRQTLWFFSAFLIGFVLSTIIFASLHWATAKDLVQSSGPASSNGGGLAAFAANWTEDTNISIPAYGGDLAGTICLPQNVATTGFAVIIAGSGPVDRNGNVVTSNLYTNTYQMLARQLAMLGIATLRYDKRGVGGSASLVTKENKKDYLFSNITDDATAVAKYLLDMKMSMSMSMSMSVSLRVTTKKWTKASGCVWLIGHSEGSTVAEVVAAQDTLKKNSSDKMICGIVTDAGPGQNVTVVLKRQFVSLPEPCRSMFYGALDSWAVKTYLTAASMKAIKVSCKNNFAVTDILDNQNYMVSWSQQDPVSLMKTIATNTDPIKPVLIVQGENDFNVQELDAQLLHQANPRASSVLLVAGMTHDQKFCPVSWQTNPQECNKINFDPTSPIVPIVPSTIQSFITFSDDSLLQ